MNSIQAPLKWTEREEFLYFFFLKLKEADFQSYSTKKFAKVFDYFAHLVMTKDRVKVKSHHQRLMKRHKSIQFYMDYYEVENANKMEILE